MANLTDLYRSEPKGGNRFVFTSYTITCSDDHGQGLNTGSRVYRHRARTESDDRCSPAYKRGFCIHFIYDLILG